MFISGLAEFENTPGVIDAGAGYPGQVDMPNAGTDWMNFGTQLITAVSTVKTANANRDTQIALANRGIVPQGYAPQYPASYTRYPITPATGNGLPGFSPFPGINGGGILLLGAIAIAAYILMKD